MAFYYCSAHQDCVVSVSCCTMFGILGAWLPWPLNPPLGDDDVLIWLTLTPTRRNSRIFEAHFRSAHPDEIGSNVAPCELRTLKNIAIRFLARCRKGRLNQPLSVLCRILAFVWVCSVILCFSMFFSLLVILVLFRGAGRVSGQGGQNSARSAEKKNFVCPPCFSVCPPCHM